MGSRRVNVKAILADADLRRQLMVSTIQATQAREGIETTSEQARRAYYVASEAEKAVFLELAPFRGGKGEPDRREEVFAQVIGGRHHARFDVARRDFATIEGVPLAYRSIGIIGHIFREAAPLEPAFAQTVVGAQTSEDDRLIRFWWEVTGIPAHPSRSFEPFAKGGPFCRFYSDIFLRVAWDPQRGSFYKWYGRKGRELPRPSGRDHYFRPGLTWPPRTQRGFNLRILPAGCVFAHKGPALFPQVEADTDFILGVGNSAAAEYLLRCLMSFGSWEVGVVKRLPIPRPLADQARKIGTSARAIHDAKAAWDKGNEISTSFSLPWLVEEASRVPTAPIHAIVEATCGLESSEESRIQRLYAEINDEVYRLYGIPDAIRRTIEETLGDRPPEILWPEMEGKIADQKRMEHVWRLLSYAVKRVVDGDDDGVVPFSAVNAEPRLVDRVRHELATLFPGRDANQVEVEIVNELKKSVKGYRKCQSLEEWLDNAYFEYHCALYKKRPIYWHIASTQGTAPFAFGALVHYHRFDKNRMAKLRATYLRDAIEEFRREAGLADKAGRSDDRLEWQSKIEETQALDKKLQLIQEGHREGAEGGDRDYRILTPWKTPAERPKGWDPDLDDGVKVNIEPLEKAGVLRIGKVT